MSHFVVLVLTALKPSGAELLRIMAPFKETDINDGGKWDWYSIGGRWTGMLVPNYDPNEDPSNTELCWLCKGTGKRPDMAIENGCNGCAGQGIRVKWPTEWKKIDGDQIRRGDLQLDVLRMDAQQTAARTHDLFTKILAGRKLPDWEALRNAHDIERAREIYHADPVMKDLRASKELGFYMDYEPLTVSREEYLAAAHSNAIQSFAVVKDGQWFQKGEMGWWGMTRGEKEPQVWAAEFAKLVEGMPADHWLTVVDCHI